MKLSKRQKVCFAILALGLGVLVVDRALLSPQGGPAGASAYSIQAPNEPAAEATEHPELQPPAVRLSEQLETLCPNNPDLSQVRDAFSLPASWLAEVHPGRGPLSEQDAAAMFAKHHQLEAVVLQSQARGALVNDHFLVIGQELDGFKLVAVDEGSVTFEARKKQVVLRLASDR